MGEVMKTIMDHPAIRCSVRTYQDPKYGLFWKAKLSLEERCMTFEVEETARSHTMAIVFAMRSLADLMAQQFKMCENRF